MRFLDSNFQYTEPVITGGGDPEWDPDQLGVELYNVLDMMYLGPDHHYMILESWLRNQKISVSDKEDASELLTQCANIISDVLSQYDGFSWSHGQVDPNDIPTSIWNLHNGTEGWSSFMSTLWAMILVESDIFEDLCRGLTIAAYDLCMLDTNDETIDFNLYYYLKYEWTHIAPYFGV